LTALAGVDLSIEDRDIAVVLGPSGSGKTTLLNNLALLDKPTSGQVFLNGTEITNLDERGASRVRNRHFGFIFQFFYLLPELTVLENIFLPLWVKERRGRRIGYYRDKAEKLLAEFHLAGRRDAYPRQLSGGEMQRVAICRAVICGPQVIFADEPTGSIDKESAQILFEMIDRLNKDRGVTFVIATHNEKFLHIASKVVYLKEGKIEKILRNADCGVRNERLDPALANPKSEI